MPDAWRLRGGRDLPLDPPVGAGIVNVTTDSMWEGARSGDAEGAVRDGRALVEAALRPEPKGVYNVVGPGEVPLSSIHGELARGAIPVPHMVARPLLGLLFKYRLANFPPPELDHIQFLCNVDGARWRQDVAWQPRHSMRDTIRSVLGE